MKKDKINYSNHSQKLISSSFGKLNYAESLDKTHAASLSEDSPDEPACSCCEIVTSDSDDSEEIDSKSLMIRILITAVLIVTAFVTEHHASHTAAVILFIAAYLLISYDVILDAVKDVLRGKIFDENFLMTAASIGALLIGEYAEASLVILLFRVGSLLEHYAQGRSRRSIKALMDIRPDHAFLVTPDGVRCIDPSLIQKNDIIEVRPGDRIPLDGVLLEGESYLDNSALTGESVPVPVHPGDTVISGGINGSGLLRVKVSRPFSQSTVSRILELTEHAADGRSSYESFITRFSRIYTPTVCALAALVALIPPLLLHQSFSVWVRRALNFLVVSCPCALVISVPLSFFGGIGAASRCGVLVKGSTFLEMLAKVSVLAFDKTGTLTEGVFEVTRIEPEGMSPRELLKISAYAESISTHPIAQSIRKAYGDEINRKLIGDIQEISGRGICAQVMNSRVLVGNLAFMRDNGVILSGVRSAGTVIYVAEDGRYAGYLVISDRVRANAAETLVRLKEAGIKKTVMLTGDNITAAGYIAESTGIDEVKAGLLPEDKVKALLDIKRELSGLVAFVGDGINDAPVLATADIGIAMGSLGSDAAIEAADIVLMHDDLSRLPSAIKIAEKTGKIAKENIIFAIGVKVLILILSVLGLTSMWAAVFGDVGVTLICILNSLRNLSSGHTV